MMVELSSGQVFSHVGGDIFRDHQMRGQEKGSRGPFWPLRHRCDRQCLENGKSERYVTIRT